MQELIFTRCDYVFNNKCSHDQYYSQFVTESVKQLVLSRWSKNTLKKAYAENQHFNSIPLVKWDAMADILKCHHSTMRLLAKANESSGTSLSDRVCVLKQAAKMIVME